MHHHEAQHQRGHTLGGDLVRPEVDQAPLLPDIAQFLEQADVAADSDQKVSPAVDDLLPIFIADEPRIGRDQRPLGKLSIICRRCSRSLLSEGPVRQSQGRPVPTCHMTVSQIWGLLAFLARERSARSRRAAGLRRFAPLPRRRF